MRHLFGTNWYPRVNGVQTGIALYPPIVYEPDGPFYNAHRRQLVDPRRNVGLLGTLVTHNEDKVSYHCVVNVQRVFYILLNITGSFPPREVVF